MNEPRFTTAEVQRIAPVTARQLQWWDEQRIIIPARAGHYRMYSRHQVVGVLLYRELWARGFSLQTFRHVWLRIQLQRVELPDPMTRWLLTNGDRVTFLQDSEEVLAFMEQRRNPLFVVIPLDPLAERIAANVASKRGPGVAETSTGQTAPGPAELRRA